MLRAGLHGRTRGLIVEGAFWCMVLVGFVLAALLAPRGVHAQSGASTDEIPAREVQQAIALAADTTTALCPLVEGGTTRPDDCAAIVGYWCLNDSTTETFLVDAGDTSTTDGSGPFCSTCTAGAFFSNVAAAPPYVRSAGTPTLRCRFNLP